MTVACFGLVTTQARTLDITVVTQDEGATLAEATLRIGRRNGSQTDWVTNETGGPWSVALNGGEYIVLLDPPLLPEGFTLSDDEPLDVTLSASTLLVTLPPEVLTVDSFATGFIAHFRNDDPKDPFPPTPPPDGELSAQAKAWYEDHFESVLNGGRGVSVERRAG